MKDWIPQVYQVISPIVISILGWLSLKLADFIKRKTENAYVEGVLLRLNDAVFTAIKDVEQTVVKALKEGTSEGKLTDTGRQNAKNAAIHVVKQHLGVKGLADLGKILGIPDGSLDAFIGSRVEAAISTTKQVIPFPRQ